MILKYLLALTTVLTSFVFSPENFLWSTTGNRASVAEAQTPSGSQWSVLTKVDPNLLAFLVKAVVVDSQTGAIGRNREGFMSVGFQRYSSRFITYGILTKNVQLVDIGIKIIEYPLSFQKTEGSFEDYAPESKGKSSASSVAFYLNDLGESLLLCKNSRWFQESNETSYLRTKIIKMNPSISNSLTWLMSQESELIKGDGNGRATNRLWKDANAYYLTGRALDRKDAVRLGEKFAIMSLQQQNTEGAFLELYGFDSSYQGVSIQQAVLFYTNLSSQANQRPIVWDAIKRAVALELKSILPSGEVNTKGNTRVAVGGETYFDKEKTVDYLALVKGLSYYHQLTQDQSIKNALDRVFTFYSKK
ncbi:hypothetical protein APA_1748 [Pseudanabaena sp. lw0831]|uniref:hypothetical protein n=1 Tax=Pseudanabaena sp. lw0831 TaxID=1357935 RepID=UPI001915CE51|nr:hypothetical protein [Pseudanabaena sp. lw0831]GBO53800.1 hypothetical protein APA_1748 [Pseudanabaena sp. lw0831]